MNSVNEYLMHHGVQGQKWGKRFGPPYPLGRILSKAREARKAHLKEKAESYKVKSEAATKKYKAKMKSKTERIDAERKYLEKRRKYLEEEQKIKELEGVKKEESNKTEGNKTENNKINSTEKDNKKQNNTNNKPFSEMTNDELKNTIERIKLEKELNDLFRDNRQNVLNGPKYLVPTDAPIVSRGRQYVNELNRDFGEYIRVGTNAVKLMNDIYSFKQRVNENGNNTSPKNKIVIRPKRLDNNTFVKG